MIEYIEEDPRYHNGIMFTTSFKIHDRLFRFSYTFEGTMKLREAVYLWADEVQKAKDKIRNQLSSEVTEK